MKNFEFKSQICTSVEQSKRLLELGLKKETADIYYDLSTHITEVPYTKDELQRILERNDVIPAWSLGRLLEVMRMKASSQVVPLDDTFNQLIEGIETRIKEGYFNKDYLEERV